MATGKYTTNKIKTLTELREADLIPPPNGMQIFTEKDISKAIINKPFRADNFAILLVTEGSFAIRYNLVGYVLTANQIFFGLPGALCELYDVAPNLRCLGMACEKSYLDKLGVQFSSAETVRFFSSDIKHKYTVTAEESLAFEQGINNLHKKTLLPSQTPFLSEIIKHNFLSVLYDATLIFYNHNAFENVKLTRKEELTSTFLDLLAKHFKKQRSVQFYAEALFITPRHLSQVVKEVTGQTAGEIIDEAVIREAKMLLPAQDATVAQVADILGFSDQSFFGKYFKKHTGITPSAYRANSIDAKNPPF